ncbi:MAG: NfeD family protein [Coriobacteriia bacterium]|nr:NfeD family protein [Coriobacteriia bacterium]
MQVQPWFWVWVALSAILFVAEIFTAGFFMLPFAVGAAVAALLEFLGVSVGWQWVAFIGVSSVLLISLRRFALAVTRESPERTGVDRLIGQTGVVIEDLDPGCLRGRVRVASEEWRADAPDCEAMPAGTRVVVERIEGTRLIVTPAEGGSAREPKAGD